MNFLDKNGWLNFLISVLGFYFAYTILNTILESFGVKMVSTMNLSINYYWLIACGVALVFALLMTIIFCKPRVPLFVGLAILIGGILSMYNTLFSALMNLDRAFRQQGIAAVYTLLPHGIIIISALLGYFIAAFSNRGSKSS